MNQIKFKRTAYRSYIQGRTPTAQDQPYTSRRTPTPTPPPWKPRSRRSNPSLPAQAHKDPAGKTLTQSTATPAHDRRKSSP